MATDDIEIALDEHGEILLANRRFGKIQPKHLSPFVV